MMSVVRHQNDRICTHVGPEGERCITRLCSLNRNKECFAHSRPTFLDRRLMERVAYDVFMRSLPTPYDQREAA